MPATTIATAVQMKAPALVEFERVIVDTTVEEKAVAYPTDPAYWRWRGPSWCNWCNTQV